MPERNIELLEKTITHITDHPEQHRQGSWVTATVASTAAMCGTTACFAGWSLLLDGLSHKQVSDLAWSQEIRQVAEEHLGLFRSESLVLFQAGNTLPMLQLMVKDLLNGEPLRRQCHYEKEVKGW